MAMTIRKATSDDQPQIDTLARKLGLDYEGMDEDAFWLAEAEGRIVGIVGLKKHADCHELCALGVDPSFRNKGLGRDLVQALLRSADRDIYLATIIPSFFKACGFEKASPVPQSMNKGPEWCEGCNRELCTIMIRKIQ